MLAEALIPKPGCGDGTWVYAAAIQRLLRLELPPQAAQQYGLTGDALVLNRVWPHSPHHLGLDYVDETGRRIAGQWLANTEEFQEVARQTGRAVATSSAAVLAVPGMQILLQLNGADRKLPGLAPQAAQPGAKLIVHQPERRGVVRLRAQGDLTFAKVVRPARCAALAATMQMVQQRAVDRFATPAVLAVDPVQGVILISALAGASLYALLGHPTLVTAAAGMGQVLRMLHSLTPPAETARHGAHEETQVLARWLTHLQIVAPTWHTQVARRAEGIGARLVSASTPGSLLHRDFYDKQVFWAGTDQVGLLDFDTLAAGEAALDLANALVHFELRALQGLCTPEAAQAAANACLAAYRPDTATLRRLPVYADATRLRLACVYACRPSGRVWSQPLLERIGTPLVPG